MIYEENIADSKAQVAAIALIIGSLQTMRVFGTENQDTLTTKCALYSSKLLKVNTLILITSKTNDSNPLFVHSYRNQINVQQFNYVLIFSGQSP